MADYYDADTFSKIRSVRVKDVTDFHASYLRKMQLDSVESKIVGIEQNRTKLAIAAQKHLNTVCTSVCKFSDLFPSLVFIQAESLQPP